MHHYTRGTIPTTFFSADGFEGPLRTDGSRGFVLDDGKNAVWGQQHLWPIGTLGYDVSKPQWVPQRATR